MTHMDDVLPGLVSLLELVQPAKQSAECEVRDRMLNAGGGPHFPQQTLGQYVGATVF